MELYYIFMVEGGTGRILVQIPMGPGRSTNCKENGGEIKIKIYFIEFLYIGFFVIDLIYIGNICIPDFL